MSAPDTIQSLLSKHAPDYPTAANFLLSMSDRWGEPVLEAIAQRAQKYGPLFWITVESGVHDILALYAKYVNIGVPEPDMHTVFQDCMRRFTALPHDQQFEDFDAVCTQFYNQPIYPILEHSFYLGLHGIDRLGRVVELLERARGHRNSSVGTARGVMCDVAVGPAVIYTFILEHLSHWRGTAYDISQHCVDYAKDVIALHGISTDRAEVKVADARSLPAADRSFDLVVATEIIEHVPNPSALLSEIWRVLKPGGSLIASTPINLPWGPHLVVFSDEAEVKSLFEAASFSCQEFVIDGLQQNTALTHGLFAKN